MTPAATDAAVSKPLFEAAKQLAFDSPAEFSPWSDLQFRLIPVAPLGYRGQKAAHHSPLSHRSVGA
jgi:hypothetical protein